MTPYSLIPIADVKPGAELAEALRDAGGALLRPAGYVLAEADLENLQRRGIQALALVTPRDPAADSRFTLAFAAGTYTITRASDGQAWTDTSLASLQTTVNAVCTVASSSIDGDQTVSAQ